MYGTILTFIKINNFGTRRLNQFRYLFHSFCCTTQCIFEPLRVYEPGFNTDKYGTHIAIDDFKKCNLKKGIQIRAS